MSRKTGVYGAKETSAALRQMAKGLPPHVIDRAAKRAMDPMLKKTKARARTLRQPSTTRAHLDQGIVFGRIKSSRTRRSYMLGATGRARSIAHLVEFGTAPHYQPKRGIMHPGAKATPFMTTSFLDHEKGVDDLFGRHLWPGIRDLALGLSRKKRR